MNSLDLDLNQSLVYTSHGKEINLYKYDPVNTDDTPMIEYVDRIPIVSTHNNKYSHPDNLHLYNGNKQVLFIDKEKQDGLNNIDIETGQVINTVKTYQNVYGENISIKLQDFTYNSADAYAQHDKNIIGINANHILRISTRSGEIVEKKSYVQVPYFTSVITDEKGYIYTGDIEGKVRVFIDLTKKAVKCSVGLGDPINSLQVHSNGDVLATTDFYVVYYPNFLSNENKVYFLGKINRKIISYLNINDETVHDGRFIEKDRLYISFCIDKYLFHWSAESLENNEQDFEIYESNGIILQHKYDNKNNSIVLTDNFISRIVM